MKAFIHVLISNLLIVILGVVQSFILPKLLGPYEYGKWSLYLLYISYAGLFSFGFCDGIYLKYGGINYNELDFSRFSGYYYSHQIFTFVLFILWSLFVVLFLNEKLFYILIGLTCFLSCNRDYFLAVNTATNRLKIFSFGQVIEKVTILIGVLLCLIYSAMRTAISMIIFAVIGWVLTYIFNIISDNKIVFKCPQQLYKPYKEYKDYIMSGLCITLASIGISLMTGIGKFGINIMMGKEYLGYYSFIFSISALFLQFFNAIGTVFYPRFKNKNQSYTKFIMQKLDIFLTYIGILLILAYYPMRMFLNVFFPQYKHSFNCLIVLLPMVIIQGKMGIVYNTMYKIWRMEKELLKNLFLGVIICLCMTVVAIAINKTIISVAIATYMSLVAWNVVTILNFNKNQNEKWKYNIEELLTVIFFIIVNYIFGFSLLSFLFSFFFIIFILIIKRQTIIKCVKELFYFIRHKNTLNEDMKKDSDSI